MKVELDFNKKELYYLAIGSPPYYDIQPELEKRNLGRWQTGIADVWRWNFEELDKLNEQELYDLYILIRESWRKVEK